ncbi:MAG TPA: 50S ribosomal protein L20 [bacterium]|nr:50S ribosomal protein L20 [bacterium]HMW35836.1 50S ribosomal protein L20 [bacterium]HMY34705.1 50S ribosomal protein L20 [bacterium]HMZ05029.1 50S ribosomal protein L20 [bacterium]HNB08647.1 50S ribosomal protein L20 [bacterium]
MPRSTNNPASKARRKKIFKQAKGAWGKRKNVLRSAIETVEKGMTYATRDRKANKRNFRSLWIIRINAAVREHGMTYSKFVAALKKANVDVNRKMLAELAMNDAAAFNKLIEVAKAAN